MNENLMYIYDTWKIHWKILTDCHDINTEAGVLGHAFSKSKSHYGTPIWAKGSRVGECYELDSQACLWLSVWQIGIKASSHLHKDFVTAMCLYRDYKLINQLAVLLVRNKPQCRALIG